MNILRRLLLLALAVAGAAASAHAAPASTPARPVLVELFTSEGCSSCPPADALLTELAQRPDVLALAYHVDYWDRLGWKDRFSSAAATARQAHYEAQLGLATLYTPQMVIDGRSDVIGSRTAEVAAALAAAHDTETVPMALSVAGDRVAIKIGAAPAKVVASVLLIGFDRRHVTTIGGGENGGRSLTETNTVRSIATLGAYDGSTATLSAPLPKPAERLAAIVQADDGRVLGLAIADAPR